MITSSAEVARRTARTVANDLASLMSKVMVAHRNWLTGDTSTSKAPEYQAYIRAVGDLAAAVTRAGGDSSRLFS